MKRQLLSLLLIGVCCAACERIMPSPTQSDYFIKLYGGRFPDQGKDVVAIPQTRDYLILGNSLSFNEGDADILLLRTDSLGNEIASESLNANGDEFAANIAPFSGNEGFAIGGTSSQNGGQIDGLVARFDWELNLQWQVLVGGLQGDESISQIIATSDGGVLAIGSTTRTDTAKNGLSENWPHDQSDIWLAKLSANGQIRWEKRYGFPGTDLGIAIREFNQEYYLLATTDYPQPFPGDDELLLVRLNEAGNILDQTVIALPDEDDQANDLEILPNGDWMVFSSYQTNGSPNYQLQLLRVAADLNQYERFELNDDQLIGSVKGENLVQLPGGSGLAFSAVRKNFALGNGDIILGKMDLKGSLSWISHFGSSAGDDLAGGLISLSEESYLLSGTLDYDNNNSMICLIKTQVNGRGEVLP